MQRIMFPSNEPALAVPAASGAFPALQRRVWTVRERAGFRPPTSRDARPDGGR